MSDIKLSLGINDIKSLDIVNRYDIAGLNEEEYLKCRQVVFAEPTVDVFSDETYEISQNKRAFAYEFLPGQYDQRADSAAQCVQIMTQREKPLIRYAKIVVIDGDITDEDFEDQKLLHKSC